MKQKLRSLQNVSSELPNILHGKYGASHKITNSNVHHEAHTLEYIMQGLL